MPGPDTQIACICRALVAAGAATTAGPTTTILATPIAPLLAATGATGSAAPTGATGAASTRSPRTAGSAAASGTAAAARSTTCIVIVIIATAVATVRDGAGKARGRQTSQRERANRELGHTTSRVRSRNLILLLMNRRNIHIVHPFNASGSNDPVADFQG